MMHRALAGLPELDHFESEDQKKLALAQIETEASNPLSRGWWLAVAILIGCVLAVHMLLRMLMPMVPFVADLHREVQDIIRARAALAASQRGPLGTAREAPGRRRAGLPAMWICVARIEVGKRAMSRVRAGV
jgi:hypothetical protein